MAQLTIAIPAEVHQALRLPPDDVESELRKELAVALYARGILPFGKARLLAGMSVSEFAELLGARQVARHYSEEDLQLDLSYAQSGQ
jgi:predicted HTH domain antitoxin